MQSKIHSEEEISTASEENTAFQSDLNAINKELDDNDCAIGIVGGDSLCAGEANNLPVINSPSSPKIAENDIVELPGASDRDREILDYQYKITEDEAGRAYLIKDSFYPTDYSVKSLTARTVSSPRFYLGLVGTGGFAGKKISVEIVAEDCGGRVTKTIAYTVDGHKQEPIFDISCLNCGTPNDRLVVPETGLSATPSKGSTCSGHIVWTVDFSRYSRSFCYPGTVTGIGTEGTSPSFMFPEITNGVEVELIGVCTQGVFKKSASKTAYLKPDSTPCLNKAMCDVEASKEGPLTDEGLKICGRK
jgi:hypothetical protein